MTKITLFRDRYHYLEYRGFSGHADYSGENTDIVCAAISILSQTYIQNSLHMLLDIVLDVESLAREDDAFFEC